MVNVNGTAVLKENDILPAVLTVIESGGLKLAFMSVSIKVATSFILVIPTGEDAPAYNAE